VDPPDTSPGSMSASLAGANGDEDCKKLRVSHDIAGNPTLNIEDFFGVRGGLPAPGSLPRRNAFRIGGAVFGTIRSMGDFGGEVSLRAGGVILRAGKLGKDCEKAERKGVWGEPGGEREMVAERMRDRSWVFSAMGLVLRFHSERPVCESWERGTAFGMSCGHIRCSILLVLSATI